MITFAMKIFRRVRRFCAVEPDKKTQWSEVFGTNLIIGPGSVINSATVIAREPTNCFLTIGDQSDIEGMIVLEKSDVQVQIGSRTHVGGSTLLDAACSIKIGDDVQIAFGSLIMDHNSHSLTFSQRQNDVLDWQKGLKDWTHVKMAPIKICDKA